jgi:hypothetical protein
LQLSAGKKTDEMAIDTDILAAGLSLQILYIPLNAGQLQVYAYLFGICHTGAEKIRAVQGKPVGNKTHPAMPSMGRKRI